MLVRNIMPVAICTGSLAISVINSSLPNQTFTVGNLGCACSRWPCVGSISEAGALSASGFLQPANNAALTSNHPKHPTNFIRQECKLEVVKRKAEVRGRRAEG